jgi:hypothetical protein
MHNRARFELEVIGMTALSTLILAVVVYAFL